MATIFHIALASEWAAAQESGAYTTSTRGRTLAEEGFIHASRGDQWTAVRDRFYLDATEPLVLLHIDTDLLDVPVVEEPAVPGSSETFPHVYGRLPASAVVKAIPLRASAPPASAPPASAPPADAPEPAVEAATPAARPAESFTRAYFREMFVNAALVTLVLVLSLVGAIVGDAAGGDAMAGVGGLVGLVLGATAATVVYRRRHARPA